MFISQSETFWEKRRGGVLMTSYSPMTFVLLKESKHFQWPIKWTTLKVYTTAPPDKPCMLRGTAYNPCPQILGVYVKPGGLVISFCDNFLTKWLSQNFYRIFFGKRGRGVLVAHQLLWFINGAQELLWFFESAEQNYYFKILIECAWRRKYWNINTNTLPFKTLPPKKREQ